jgi:hypothetical protein
MESRPALADAYHRLAGCKLEIKLANAGGKWSGRWESNPRLKLGKLGYYHYTTPATCLILIAFHGVGNWFGVAVVTVPGGDSKPKIAGLALSKLTQPRAGEPPCYEKFTSPQRSPDIPLVF